MRLLASCILYASLTACGAHHGSADAAAPDGGRADGARPDGTLDAGPACGCRTGAYRVEGEGSGFSVAYDLVVRECDGASSCTVDGTERRCHVAGGAFRVDLDSAGYTQLVFFETPCDAPWTGTYATHGSSASVTAVRVE